MFDPFKKVKCRVCGAEYYRSGIKNHVYGKAKSELFDWWLNQGEDKPHADYVAKHGKVKKVERINFEI